MVNFRLLAIIFLLASSCSGKKSIVDEKVIAEKVGFPLIMYAVPPNSADFNKVKAMGCNYVHQYGLTSGDYDASKKDKIKKYLDLAYRHGLKVMLDLDGTFRMRTAGDKVFTDFKQVVQDFKNHPALGIWYLFDEPEWESTANPEKLQKYYALLKAESPDIPVAICFSTKTDRTTSLKYIWSDFLSQTDIVAFDTYPVYGQQFPNARLSDVSDFTQKALASNKAVMPALQIFDWKTIQGVVDKAKAGTYHIKEAGNNPETWRYPNIQELRYWGFSALIQNVQGLMLWSYSRSVIVEHADPKWIDGVLSKLTKEISEFTKMIDAEGYVHKKVNLSNSNVLSAIWENNKGSVLVVANQTGTTQIVSDSVLSKYIDGGQTELAPWEVVILKSRQ